MLHLSRIDKAMHVARDMFCNGAITEAMFRAVHKIWMDAHVTEFFTPCDELFIEHIEQKVFHDRVGYAGATVH